MERPDGCIRRLRFLVPLLGLCTALPLAAQVPFEPGDVFAGTNGGKIMHFDAGGDLRQVLDGGGQRTGMCFDGEGRLYATDFTNNEVSVWSRQGVQLHRRWGGPYNSSPESCVVDGDGHVYTGEADHEQLIRKFDAGGNLLATFDAAGDDRGTDWIELAADQCTMYYTSEGRRVKRYDVCRDRQLPDFAGGLQPDCYSLRLRDNGELMVACQAQIYRLGAGGQVMQTYPITGEYLFAMNLDPDGKTFWTAGQQTGNVYRVDIETGNGAGSPHFSITKPQRRSTGFELLDQLGSLFDNIIVGGLAIYGERTAAQSVNLPPPAPPPPEPPPPPPPPPAPPPQGVDFGRPQAVDFQEVDSGSEELRALDLSGSRVEGEPSARLTTNLDLTGVVLEVETPGGWQDLGASPVELPLSGQNARRLPLRLRVGRCPPATSDAEDPWIEIESIGVDGGPSRLRVPLSLTVRAEPWYRCWMPLIVAVLVTLVAAFVIYGFICPSRFSGRAGVVLSPEEDMSEGFFHPIRAQRGSRSGFYRDARVHIGADFRITGKARGALVRLRADGKRVMVLPVQGARVVRQNVEGDWEPLPPAETVMRYDVYRDELGTIFFQLRGG